MSPASSEGSSAIAARSRAKEQEGVDNFLGLYSISWLTSELAVGILKKDKSYRRYAAGVERALSLFDTALQEWADYISFLSRLLKVTIH